MGKVEGDSMKLPESVEPFYGPLEAIQHLLEKFNGRGVVIGDVAASLLGKPRFTVDVGAVFLLSIEESHSSSKRQKPKGSFRAFKTQTSLRTRIAFCF
jgi:hypothetical protein